MEETVSQKHNLYDDLKTRREKVQDLIQGTEVIRSKGTKYLPKFPEELPDSYNNRLRSSTLFNIYAKTQSVMVGLVFNEQVELADDVDADILKLAESIDNQSNHLNVFARDAFDLSFEGCSVILVDSPTAEVTTLAEQNRLGIRPYWSLYTADNVINWRYSVNEVTRQTELSMIVLREVTTEPTGKFSSTDVVRYRAYFLDGGVVSLEVYKEIETDKGTVIVLESERTLPQLSQIPVGIVGGLESAPPMLDLAHLNIKHFQKESNFDNLEVIAAVPLFYTKGLELAEGERMIVGADVHYRLSDNGAVGWSQIDGSGFSSLRESLKALEDDMSLLGLNMLVAPTAQVDKTATEAVFHNIAETAQLRVMGVQLQDTLELCLGHTAEFLGIDRKAGGSVIIGAIWNQNNGDFVDDLERLSLKADIANKLTGIMSTEWIIKFLGVSDEAEMNEILEQIRAGNAVVVETETFEDNVENEDVFTG